jgi:hypothetical protein
VQQERREQGALLGAVDRHRLAVTADGFDGTQHRKAQAVDRPHAAIVEPVTSSGKQLPSLIA